MSQEFKLPEVQDGVDEVDIGEIFVSVGDQIESGTPLMEVETEKAAAPVESDISGTVLEIKVSEGQSVAIGTVLLTVGAADEAAEKPADSDSDSGADTAANNGEAESHTAANAGQVTPDRNTFPESPDKSSSTPAQNKLARPDLSREIPPPAAPHVRTKAREMGIDLREISGSGGGGRITLSDLTQHSGGGAGGALAPSTVRGGGGVVSAPTLPDFQEFGPITREPLKKLAKTAARNLSLAWQIIPHVTQQDMVDITELEAARKRFVKGIGQGKPKITMTAIMTKAIVTVLREFPKFNASFDAQSEEIVYKNYYHVGIAVDTEFGLVVPVIRDADQKSMIDIAADLTEIAGKARDRKLGMDDMQGGTFTVTNLGGIGGTSFTPIVNYPEVAILGMSRSQKQLELDDAGNITQKLMLPLSLSYDHRVINGADAARFMVRLNGLLADPMQLMVEV